MSDQFLDVDEEPPVDEVGIESILHQLLDLVAAAKSMPLSSSVMVSKDEVTSLVQAALANLMQGRTVVVIAHRLGTVRRANRIAVLEDGRITAVGSHDELLKTSPTYQRLYELQFMGGNEGFLPDTIVVSSCFPT